MKRILFMLIAIFMFMNIGYSVTTISQCPGSLIDSEEYLLDTDFIVNSNPCFDFDGTTGVIVNGQGNELDISLTVEFGTSNDTTIKNLDITQFRIHEPSSNYVLSYNVDGLDFINNTIRDQTSDALFFLGAVGSSVSQATLSNFNFEDNLIYSTSVNQAIFYVRDDTNSFGAPYMDLYNLTMRNNDIIGFTQLFTSNNLEGEPRTFDNTVIEDNNFLVTIEIFDESQLNIANCGTFTYSNNFDSTLDLEDADYNGVTDSVRTLTVDGCILENAGALTKQDAFNQDKNFFDDRKLMFINHEPSNPNFLDSNSRIMFSRAMTLDGTNNFNMDGKTNIFVDLSLFKSNLAFSLESVRSIRMGSGNTISGARNDALYPIIDAGDTVPVTYLGYYDNNYHLVEYDNNARIEHVSIELNNPEASFVRKKSSAVDGINFQLYDSYFQLGYLPEDKDMPYFLIGCKGDFQNNQFDMGAIQNVTIFGAGTCSNVGGGHYFVNNTFSSGGAMFEGLIDAIGGMNLDNKFIYNSFGGRDPDYSYPFTLDNDEFTLMLNPQLNGSYFYETPCTNYEFNIGNYYEDLDDLGSLIDGDGDDIADSSQFRGNDYLNNSINDDRALMLFPYDFASQLANAESTTDTCAVLNFNVISPTEQNYTSGSNVITDWEYTSVTYSDMYCFENINGFESLYQNVDSGVNQGLDYDLSDGQFYFDLKCCDTIQCDNVEREIETIPFCVGDCNLGLGVVQGVSAPPVDVFGCTDPSANNYNPSATVDDGSCTYDNGNGNQTGGQGVDVSGFTGIQLFGDSTAETSDNIGEFFQLFENPLGWMLILGVTFFILAVISLIFAFLRYMIR